MSAWSDVRRAVQRAIVASSGLPASRVIWAFQNADAPDDDYCSISISSILTIGQDWLKKTYDATRPPAQAFKVEVQGIREVGFQLTFFSGQTVADTDAMVVAETARSKLIFDDVRALLKAVGVSPFDPGPVQYVPEIQSVGFTGRATVLLRCYVPAQAMIEYVTFIEHLNATFTARNTGIGDVDFDFSVDLD